MDNMDISSSAEPAGQPMPWYEVWMEVVTHPSKDSFRRILSDPTAGAARAFMWVGVIGLIFGILQAVVTQVTGVSPAGGMGLATSMACLAIGVPIFSVIGLAIGAGILRFIAGLLGGTGNFNDLTFSLGAVSAPISIVSSLISLIVNVVSGGTGGTDLAAGGSGSILALCLAPISLGIAVYAIVLQVMAVSVVEKLTTGKAVLTVLIPVIVLFLLGACIALVFGAAAFSILQQMGQ